ncbi:hypothetical protein [Actinotignum urinale]|uniref:hypothetical protein n=1 Tax=Actinotignum urinale TaxID=190146 RepID=UPI0003B669F2|nr:hypothetical protein [Actinotignum urinale]MDY5159570.1 hypothetical protein [Actinotignum urinale]
MFDVKTFDLAKFISGCTQETRFVDVCKDRALLARLDYVRSKLREDTPKTTYVGGTSLEKEFKALQDKLKDSWLRVEISAPSIHKYTAFVRAFCEENGIDYDNIVAQGEGIPEEYAEEYAAAFLLDAMVFPKLSSREQVRQFLDAIGSVQERSLLTTAEEAVSTSLASLGPDSVFWRMPSPAQNGEES